MPVPIQMPTKGAEHWLWLFHSSQPIWLEIKAPSCLLCSELKSVCRAGRASPLLWFTDSWMYFCLFVEESVEAWKLFITFISLTLFFVDRRCCHMNKKLWSSLILSFSSHSVFSSSCFLTYYPKFDFGIFPYLSCICFPLTRCQENILLQSWVTLSWLVLLFSFL